MDLNYKGMYKSNFAYAPGSVVKFEDDGVWYIRNEKDPNMMYGIPCNDSLRWGRADPVVATAAEMVYDEATKRDTDIPFDWKATIQLNQITVGETVMASGATKAFKFGNGMGVPAWSAAFAASPFGLAGFTNIENIRVTSLEQGDDGYYTVTLTNCGEEDAVATATNYKIGAKIVFLS